MVISASSDGSGEGELSLSVAETLSLSMVEDVSAQPNPGDPRVLIQSPTTEWVMRRGVADRAIWHGIASAARQACESMAAVDELNGRMNTGRLLYERRDAGHYGDLHHPFHDNPCLPPVGNYPLSVMGALLSPGLEQEFRITSTFGTAMEAIAYDWNQDPAMVGHVQLMAAVANIVSPFLTVVKEPLCSLIFSGNMEGVG